MLVHLTQNDKNILKVSSLGLSFVPNVTKYQDPLN